MGAGYLCSNSTTRESTAGLKNKGNYVLKSEAKTSNGHTDIGKYRVTTYETLKNIIRINEISQNQHF